MCNPSLNNSETKNWSKCFGITYPSSVEDRDVVKLTKLATGAAHCPDALAVTLPLEAGVALISAYGMSESIPMVIAPMRNDKKETVEIQLCGELTLITDSGKHSGSLW